MRDNGVLTLGIGSDNADLSRPRPLPVLDILYLVAPFWHHLDNQIENREEIEDEIVEDGLVSTETLYKVYPLGLNSTNLNIVNNYVQNVLGDTDFIGSWMLLAQWNATYRLSVMDIEDSTNTNNNTATGSGNNTNTNNNTATGSGNNTNTNNNTASGSGTNTISTLVSLHVIIKILVHNDYYCHDNLMDAGTEQISSSVDLKRLNILYHLHLQMWKSLCQRV